MTVVRLCYGATHLCSQHCTPPQMKEGLNEGFCSHRKAKISYLCINDFCMSSSWFPRSTERILNNADSSQGAVAVSDGLSPLKSALRRAMGRRCSSCANHSACLLCRAVCQSFGDQDCIPRYKQLGNDHRANFENSKLHQEFPRSYDVQNQSILQYR